MIPAANGPERREERERRRRDDADDVDVDARGCSRPAAIAATNMSPERRVSWPTTMAPPGPTRRCAVARPRAYASVGLRSTLATPRMPSVPNSRAIVSRPAVDGAASAAGEGEGDGGATIVTRTVAGGGRHEREPGRQVDRDRDLGRAGAELTDASFAVSAAPSSRSRSATEPPMVSRTRSTSTVVGQVGLGAIERHARLERPRRRHRPQRHADRHLVAAERHDAGRQVVARPSRETVARGAARPTRARYRRARGRPVGRRHPRRSRSGVSPRRSRSRTRRPACR